MRLLHTVHLVYPSFEQWELGFLRDSHPMKELAMRCAIAKKFERLRPFIVPRG